MARSPASLDDLLVQIKITNRLLAARLKDNMQQYKIISLLASTGASHQDIADVLDTTPGVISTTLSRQRKKSKANNSD